MKNKAKIFSKCPYLDIECEWRMSKKHKTLDYLNNACYLSGSFEEMKKEECPHNKRKDNIKKFNSRMGGF